MQTKFQQLLNWISIHFTIIQLISLIFTLAIGFICKLIFESIKLEGFIIPLLVFLSVDFLILVKVFLEKIDSNTSEILEISKKSNSGIKKCEKESIYQKVFKAKHSVFIGGIHLRFLGDTSDVEKLNQLHNKGRNIIIAIAEFDIPYIDDYLISIYGRDKNYRNIHKNNFNTNIEYIFKGTTIFMDAFLTNGIIAIDYDSNNRSSYSRIYLRHYLFSKKDEPTNTFYLEILPSSPLFKMYEEQIKLIIESKGKIAKFPTFLQNKNKV